MSASSSPVDDERPRFLTDEDFNLNIVAGLRRVRPQIDILTAQEAVFLHVPDPLLLRYGQEHDRILLSHDMQTMLGHFADFLTSLPSPDQFSPGLILLPQETAVGVAIQWLLEIWEASRHDEWRNLPIRLPL